MIENRQFRFSRRDLAGRKPGDLVEERLRESALRWYVAAITDDEIVAEATVLSDGLDEPAGHAAHPYRAGKSVVVSVIPTGVGCAVGGYAGDAAPATRLLARTADYVVTNPNAVNASSFISLEPNVLYTEGLCIDQFVRGQVELYVPYANRVGLIIEKTSRENLEMVYNVVNTARAVYGVDVVDCVVTDGPIGSHCELNRSGAYVGTVDHPEEIHAAAERLVERGAQAIGITTNIQDLPHDEYVRHFEGEFPNPMGGVEAIMSHMIVHRFRLPAAHAPMVNLKDLALEHNVVDARGAGEMASPSGLACVLIGLAKAPQVSLERSPRIADAVNVGNLLAVVTPAGCLGGIPAIYAERHGVAIVAVRENTTVLDVDGETMGLGNVFEVASYAEAAGLVLALRHGIDPKALNRPMATMRPAADEAGSPRRETFDSEPQMVHA